MASNTATEKTLLRVEVRRALTGVPLSGIRESDHALFQNLMSLPQVAWAKTIALFWGVTKLEPDTGRLITGLLEMGKTVCLPRVVSGYGMEFREYSPGCPMARACFGILEPTIDCPLVAKERVDLAVVPALCYDRRGYRLGYGGGYYDRWLSGFHGATVGMCRELVLRDHVPTQKHDRPVQVVVTENEVFTFQ